MSLTKVVKHHTKQSVSVQRTGLERAKLHCETDCRLQPDLAAGCADSYVFRMRSVRITGEMVEAGAAVIRLDRYDLGAEALARAVLIAALQTVPDQSCKRSSRRLKPETEDVDRS